jgi:hypothetical protein
MNKQQPGGGPAVLPANLGNELPVLQLWLHRLIAASKKATGLNPWLLSLD